jgi:hypothetical protein
MAPDFMQYYQQICLAQAQECILEKSMMDNRKSTIIGKLIFYNFNPFVLALLDISSNTYFQCYS